MFWFEVMLILFCDELIYVLVGNLWQYWIRTLCRGTNIIWTWCPEDQPSANHLCAAKFMNHQHSANRCWPCATHCFSHVYGSWVYVFVTLSNIWKTFECWSPQWLNFFKNYTLSELVCSQCFLLITNYIQCNPLLCTAVFDKLLMDDGHHLFASRQLIVKTYCKQMSFHSL